MRANLHVTQRAFDFPADATRMSTNDPETRITHASDAFVAISGRSSEEIGGRRPHNPVRHPDLRAEAFADMWATLGGGEPWTGLVPPTAALATQQMMSANSITIIYIILSSPFAGRSGGR